MQKHIIYELCVQTLPEAKSVSPMNITSPVFLPATRTRSDICTSSSTVFALRKPSEDVQHK